MSCGRTCAIFGSSGRTRRSPTSFKPSKVGKKVWFGESFPEDADDGELASNGRVMEMLSEHTVEGWLEGYLLSGRHGLSCLRGPVIHRSDQGYPYTSIAFGQQCRAGVQPSMGSVVGDAYDNGGQL
jgi:hypothetical protein